ncbi:transcriptional repressor [Bacillus swezeyi]|nr:Fur family transcriptional regulator [Bacillus swezeyi]KAA6481987.1 transcriptional repressor [Bacillus swezeyi]
MAKLKQEVFTQLKEKGVRVTPQRFAIYYDLLAKQQHPAAEELYKSLKSQFPTISPGTVYNTLRYFKKSLIKKLNFGETIRFDAAVDDHYYVICETCGQVVDFYYPYLYEVEKFAAKKTGYKVTHHRLEFYGICEKCKYKKT